MFKGKKSNEKMTRLQNGCKQKIWQNILLVILFLNIATVHGNLENGKGTPYNVVKSEGRILLEEAFQSSPKINFQAVLKDSDFFPINLGKGKAEFSRHAKSNVPNEPLLKLNVFAEDGKLISSYIANENGKFAMHKEEWNQIMEILPLYYLENMHEKIPEFEMDNSNFSVSNGMYMDRPCYRITVTTGLDALEKIKFRSKEIVSEPPKQSEKAYAIFVQNRPMTRVFLIDKTTKFIYSRKHYGRKNNLVYSREVGKITFPERMDMQIFVPDKKVKKVFLSLRIYEQNIFSKEYKGAMKRPNPIIIKIKEALNRFCDVMFSDRAMSIYPKITSVISVVTIMAIIFLKVRRR